MVKNQKVRVALTKESHWYFFHFYFAHYVAYPTADFQQELFAITEDDGIKTAVIEAFRNSAKTTIVGLSFPIWAILGKQQRKFILLLAQTQTQARQYLTNIKRELESNNRLRADLGPFEEPDDEWRAVSIVLPKYGARITAASVDQPIRGLRHGPYRPDLIICDDLEDLNSVRNRDSRNKLYDWLMGDIIPLGDISTRLMVIGTRLHEDSLIMRLRHLIKEGRISGIAKSYPLIDENGNIAWPGKFSDQSAIEAEQKKSGDERAWRREYLLEIVGDTDQVIDLGWIHRYDKIPYRDSQHLFDITAVDLAISESDRADYTAIVTAKVYADEEDKLRICIMPDPVNERLDFPSTVERISLVVKAHHQYSGYAVVEDIGYQRALIQELETRGFNVIPFKPGKADKRTRLSLTAGMVKSGEVLFPTKGVDHLISQIVHFGRERHDDLSDAFAMLVLEAKAKYGNRPGIIFIDVGPRSRNIWTVDDDW